jgi:hypothetical protein
MVRRVAPCGNGTGEEGVGGEGGSGGSGVDDGATLFEGGEDARCGDRGAGVCAIGGFLSRAGGGFDFDGDVALGEDGAGVLVEEGDARGGDLGVRVSDQREDALDQFALGEVLGDEGGFETVRVVEGEERGLDGKGGIGVQRGRGEGRGVVRRGGLVGEREVGGVGRCQREGFAGGGLTGRGE